MDNVKNKTNRLQILTIFIPLVFSTFFAVFCSATAAVLWAASVLAVISFVPVFDKHENLWAFLCVALSGIPANILIIVIIMQWDFFSYYDSVLLIFYSIILYSMLFSVEEIVFGIAVRFLHPRQYKLNL